MSGRKWSPGLLLVGFLAIISAVLSPIVATPYLQTSLLSRNMNAASGAVRLHTRANVHNLQPHYFTTTEWLSSPSTASQALLDLYHGLLATAINDGWKPPHPFIVFRFGQFELGFFSGAGDIEWDFVIEFAQTILTATRAGYASMYQTTWTNPEQTRAVSIMLRLAQ